jgi:hypothetical protein
MVDELRVSFGLFDFERLSNGVYNEGRITNGSQVQEKHTISKVITQFRCKPRRVLPVPPGPSK